MNNINFQDWMNANEYTDVRFYPVNPEESSTVDILKSALHSVKEYEKNGGKPYQDNIKETYF